MRRKDPELMEQIKLFAEDFCLDEGRSPSTTEIANAFGIARSMAYRYLVEMDERGMIRYNSGEISTNKIDRISPVTGVAVYNGAIPCGPLDVVEASVEEYVKLPTSIFGDGELFIIRATGDSMVNAGIESGDLVVVRKQETANVGDIVVALYDNANTLKRLGFDSERQTYMLVPESDTMQPIYVDDLSIQGVARQVIKSL